MDLIVYQVVKLQVMHVSDGSRAVEILAGAAVAEKDFSVSLDRHALPEGTMLQIIAEIFHNLRLNQVFVLLLEVFPFHVHIVVCKL